MSMDISMDLKKERIIELNHRQKVTLATLFNGCSTSCVLCFVQVEHTGSKQSCHKICFTKPYFLEMSKMILYVQMIEEQNFDADLTA